MGVGRGRMGGWSDVIEQTLVPDTLAMTPSGGAHVIEQALVPDTLTPSP